MQDLWMGGGGGGGTGSASGILVGMDWHSR